MSKLIDKLNWYNLVHLSDPFFSYGDTLEVLTSHKTKIAYELMVCYNMTQGHFGKLKVTGKKSEKIWPVIPSYVETFEVPISEYDCLWT